jgi:hypothetical protein
VGKIDHGLNTPLKPSSADFVEEQGKYHGYHDSQDYLAARDPHGVPQCPGKFHHVKEEDEIFKAHPPGTHDPQGGKVILKSHYQSPDRDIVIDKNQYYRGKQHKMQGPGIVFLPYRGAFPGLFRFHAFFLSK